MKKVLVVLLFVFSLFPARVLAGEIVDGTSSVNIYLGLSTALQKSGMELLDKEFSWGNIGGEVGLSYLYYPTAFWGLGVDIHYAGFKGSEKEIWDEHNYMSWHWANVNMDMSTFWLTAASRINLNPDSPSLMFYVPFGVGLVVSDGTIGYERDSLYKVERSATDTSLGWYAGLGVEFSGQENWALGLEGRYSTFRYDVEKLARRVGGDITTGKEKDYSYISLLLSFSFR